MGIELFFVKKRILSLVAGVAFSKRRGLFSECQSGRSSFIAEGSTTLPESMWAPISPAFSSKTTRKSSLPASFASCFSLSAALSPAGPESDQRLELQQNVGCVPPPMMQTSTSSLSRSCCLGLEEDSTSAYLCNNDTERSLLLLVGKFNRPKPQRRRAGG